MLYFTYYILGGLTAEYYPCLQHFQLFLSLYLVDEGSNVRCFGCNQSALEPLDYDTTGTVLVNAFGLTVISFDSVTNFAPNLFGNSYRGYLITFKYCLLNGFGSFPTWRLRWSHLKILVKSRLLVYGRDHVVSICVLGLKRVLSSL